ncbi:hypothetical protein [Anaerobranca gottschalkii]|uniref:Uncharacterized protein n=1 Tax=Anaerobranca gottschalkii DSM 13577 TaxID=1120990 RepID=A0A1I0C4L2_9FIRM|nr:hypothetical protein [Anaerobranca gottschalkii]SET13692.1 hypothetical protein SAMN03080614_10567 [Anaerobranca gottschalkii DSM 13577]
MFRQLKRTRDWFYKVFNYPKVEYIPISFQKIHEIPINNTSTNNFSRINVYKSLNEIPFNIPPTTTFKPGLFLTLSHNQVVKIKFRGRVCTVVADPNPQKLEILWINSRYFPPNTTIHFTVVSKTGVRITWTNFHYFNPL